MKTIISAFSLFVVCSLWSQHDQFNCGSHHKEAELQMLHPEIEAAYKDMRRMVNNLAKSNDSTIVIPIVFHVVHLYGQENISDQQIYRQVEILNEDFQKLNADTINIVPYFLDRVGNPNIRFELARFDPFGECSNGINRYYNFETLNGDDFSKLNAWPRTRYLNVWIVRTMENGVAGYAYYPSSVEGVGFWRDGIIIRHNFIGDIGTGSPTNSRALTHEIGHWLGLAHTWGSTNNPGLLNNCLTDDGIDDTPNTIGWTTCNLNGMTCDNELDNVQNYMEYSYCSNMFTEGQANFMRTVLNSTLAGRNALWNEHNLNMTLGDLDIPLACNPVADFNSNIKLVCMNTPIQFNNFSWRIAGNATYFWEFPESNTPTSSAINPSVSWSTPGWKTVKLTVTDEQGTHTKTEVNYLFVGPDYQDYVGPQTLTFDLENHAQYLVFNPENNEAKWNIENNVGIGGSKGIILRNVSPHTDFLPFSNEFFYQNRLGGKIDEFITPSFDLSNTSNVNVSFFYAAATNANAISDMTERLRIYVSTNCGQTWTLRQTLTGMDLINNGTGHLNFVPINNSIWSESTFFLTANQTSGNVRLKFEYTASDFSNNIVIDNIRISGVLNIENLGSDFSDIIVYPNPGNANEPIIVNIPENLENISLHVFNGVGQEILMLDENTLTGQAQILLNQYTQFTKGFYYLTFSDQVRTHTLKLVIL
jgi:PKD repeat protein